MMTTPRKILFSCLPLLGFLTCGEVTTRVVNTPECSSIQPDAGDWETMIGDPNLLWKLEPNRRFETGNDVTQINSSGLRESLDLSTPKRSKEKRIAVTGDSSIYGWGVKDNETYAIYLERELRRRFKNPIEVINLGVPGYSTEQTIRLLDDIGWSYQPDLLIVSNIFSDCNIDAFQDKQALALANPDRSLWYRSLRGSRLYCSFYMPWARYQANLNQNPNRVLMPGIPVGPNAAVALENLNNTLALSRVPLSDYLENLETIRQSAAERNAQMLLAPLAQEWDVGIWNVPMPPPSDGHVLPWEPYRSAQKAWAKERNIEIISFPEAFASYNGDKATLFVDNMHPSKHGTSLMAKTVAEHLKNNPQLLGLTTADLRTH